MTNRPRVAIAHDYLTQRGGAERVVLALSRAFPEAPIYTTIYDPEGTFPDFADREIVTSPLSRIPALRHDHRRALPLLAPVSSRLRVDADVTVASSSGWAHGFATTGRTLVYCHNPARWLYQADEYLGDAGRRSPTRLALGVLTTPLRRWDRRAAARADRYLANSGVVRERVARAYGIEADVVPPPPGLDSSGPQEAHPELAAWADRPFWLVVSRLLPYKNVDVALEAFRGRPGERLVVVGAGPERDRLVAAAPDNVRIVSGGQRRRAALDLRARGRAGRSKLRGLRPDPARGQRLGRAGRRAAGRRLPRHGGGGPQRRLLRRAHPGRRRRGARPSPAAHLVGGGPAPARRRLRRGRLRGPHPRRGRRPPRGAGRQQSRTSCVLTHAADW